MNAQQAENLTQDNEVAVIAEEIAGTLEGAIIVLLERRDRKYADAIAPLNEEVRSLTQESNAMGEAAQSLEELLPAKARVAQAEHDRLLVAGDREGAAEKLTEQKQAEDAPATMRTRQEQIANRLTGIEEEKRAAAKRVFSEWYAECQSVVRSAERGLFTVLLDGLWNACLEFESRVCPPRSAQDQMVRSNHKINLTADARSEEWQAATRWYAGRTQ